MVRSKYSSDLHHFGYKSLLRAFYSTLNTALCIYQVYIGGIVGFIKILQDSYPSWLTKALKWSSRLYV